MRKRYVQVERELWRAQSTGSNIGKGGESLIIKMKRLTLLVTPLSSFNGWVSE